MRSLVISGLVAALALSPAGCRSGGRAPGAQPSWRGGAATAARTEPRIIELKPETAGARAYNELPAAPVPRSRLGDAVLDSVARAAQSIGRPAPRADARLFRAAAELARVAPDDAPLAYGLIEFALQHSGIMEPSPHLVVIRAPLDEPDAIATKLDERLPTILGANDFARIGVGAAQRDDGDDVIVLALQASFITTGPVPRALPAGGKVRLEGEVAAPFAEPEVFVTREDGEVERVALTVVGERGFRAELRCDDHAGRQQVEINAEDATGATVLANFPIWCGAVPPDEVAVALGDDDVRPVTSGEDAEQRMLKLVNRDRAQHGLAELALDPRVVAVARAHSEDMRRTGVIAHISPTTGSAADRLAAASVRSAVILENVARAYGVTEAEEGLMNSPGHRANLLSREVSHLGLGIVLGDDVAGRRELFVTQLFIRVAGKLDVASGRKRVAQRLAEVRVLDEDPALSQVAQGLAAALARGEDAKVAAAGSAARLEKLGGTYGKVTTVATTVADLEVFRPGAQLEDRSVLRYGLGLSQGSDAVMGDGAVHVVLLFGHR